MPNILESKTIRLIKIMDSVFSDQVNAPKNEKEKLELYKLASRNKIGLLYLERLAHAGMLDSLKKTYDVELVKERIFMETIANLYRHLNGRDILCVMFKTILPFHCNRNDVDVVIMDSSINKEDLVNYLRGRGYIDYEKHSPVSISIHDAREGPHLDPEYKDPYDIDIYDHIGINLLRYLDKEKLREHIVKIQVNGQDVWNFSPEADLATQIGHSVIAEQMYTLLHYYSVLYNIDHFTEKQMNSFLTIAQNNRIILASDASLSASFGSSSAIASAPLRRLMASLSLPTSSLTSPPEA